MKVNKNTDSITLEEITRKHYIVFSEGSFWFQLARKDIDADIIYCAINIMNNDVVTNNNYNIVVADLEYWHNKAEEMHAFYSLDECLKFIKS